MKTSEKGEEKIKNKSFALQFSRETLERNVI